MTAAPPSRRERNKARTRAAIIAAARRSIVELGAAATTMDLIAERADVSRATLFNYFPGKPEILRTVIEELDDAFYTAIDDWRAVDAVSTAQRIVGLFAGTGRALGRAGAGERVLIGLSEMSWNEAAGAIRLEKLAAAFRAMLSEGIARGDVAADTGIDVVAEMLVSLYVGMIHRWRLMDDYPIASRLEAAARILAATIAPAEALPADAPRLPRRGGG